MFKVRHLIIRKQTYTRRELHLITQSNSLLPIGDSSTASRTVSFGMDDFSNFTPKCFNSAYHLHIVYIALTNIFHSYLNYLNTPSDAF